MKKKYLFYFCDGIGSVFDSQVLALLDAINERNLFKKIYLLIGIRNKEQKNDLLNRNISNRIEVIFYKSYPNYPFFNYLNTVNIRAAINRPKINLNEIIFHTRGELIASYVAQSVGTKYYKSIIPDIRGSSVEEIEEFYNFNNVIKTLKINNYKKAIGKLKNYRKVSVVSKSLKEYLFRNYDLDQEKIGIANCLAGKHFRFDETQRERVRIEFNLSANDILIVFSSGGTANWQNTEILIMLADKGLKVLNLSKKTISHKNIFNKFVAYYDMPLYLNAADAAIIWRDKSIVNKVASPVKFSEYICCGLPVIANTSVDMINDFITQHHCGLLINNLEDLDSQTVEGLKKKDRMKISELGLLHFGIDTIVEKYSQIYDAIN